MEGPSPGGAGGTGSSDLDSAFLRLIAARQEAAA